jgi:NAD(P)-dependent dehydrogenase (short-subunit alcohol dehydrogenase family)
MTLPANRLLAGKLALITGAGAGIGAGIAAGMAEAGARVLVADIDPTAAHASAGAIGHGAVPLTLDVTDRAAIAAAAKLVDASHGPIDILVNNAGILRRGGLDADTAEADWDATFAVNLDAPFSVTRAFAAQLRRTRGAVINIASIQAFVALDNSAAYTASKGGVRLLTKALAIELSPHGVRVNAIAPGRIATAINAAQRADPIAFAAFLKRIPLGRVGEPEDVAGAAVFLASDLARYVTGATLPVDGGYLAY